MINQNSQVVKFPSLKKALTLLFTLLVLAAGGLLVAIIFGVLAFQIIYLDRAYPGATVAGIDVSGMTRPEIVDLVTTQADEILNETLTIQIGDETHTFTKEELGVYVDVEATADKAYQLGRQGNLLVDVPVQLSLLSRARDVQPVILYNTGPSHQMLQSLIAVSDYPPQNAQLVIHSADKVEIVPAQFGQRLHLDATRPLIEAALFSDNTEPIQAVTQKIQPALSNEAVASTYRQVTNLLAKPLTFSYKSQADNVEWHIEPKTLVSMIDLVEQVDDNGKLQLKMDLKKDMFTPYYETFAKRIDQEGADAELRFDEEENKLVVLKESKDSYHLDINAAWPETVKAIENGTNFVELPVVETPARIPSQDLEALGINALVSEATSYFSGSAEGRMNNIEVAASKFDGVVVPPGEIFSFVDHLGEVTKEEGYDESLIIYGDRTTVGIGGGVCQVSTTAFRAAFFGGFEIVERWAHGYRVGWYEINSEIGLDATVYAPYVDFKFRNDTDHFLLIHTESDLEAGTVTFKIFGTPTNREVTVSEPVVTNVVKHGPPIYENDPSLADGVIKQVDWAQDGMNVSVTRLVKEGDKLLYNDEIVSRYQPWTAIYKVGTKRTQPSYNPANNAIYN